MNTGPRMMLVVAVLALCALPAAVKLVCYADYPGSDDAFIHLTIARNFAAGSGWGVNPGQTVHLSTSPLFTLAVSVPFMLGLPPIPSGMAISLAFSAGALALLWLVAGRFTDNPLLRLAALAIAATNVQLWRWNGTVMETTAGAFFLVLVLTLYYRWARESEHVWTACICTGLVIGAATLVRFELGLLLPAIALELILSRPPRWPARMAAISAALATVAALWAATALAVFGSILPTTYYAKTAGLQLVNLATGKALAIVVASAYAAPALAAVLALAALLLAGHGGGIVELARQRAALFFFPVALFAYYYVQVPDMQSPARYFMPALFALPLCFAAIFDLAARRLPRKAVVAALVFVVAAQAATALGLNSWRVAPVLRGFEDNYGAAQRSAAAYMAQRCGPGDTVLAHIDIGMISYYGEGRYLVADGGALASPDLLGLSVSEQIDAVKPKFVVETLGLAPAGLAEVDKRLRLLRTTAFSSHSVGYPELQFYCNIFAAVSGSEQ